MDHNVPRSHGSTDGRPSLFVDPAPPMPGMMLDKHNLGATSAHFAASALPPTPMSAYFDAEETAGDGFAELNVDYPLSSSSPQPTSSTAGIQSLAFSSQGRTTLGNDAGSSINHVAKPSSDLPSIDATEMEYEGSAGNRSMSSEAESPGPLTPATPAGAWKPRELTLLRSRASDTDGNGPAAERGRGLEGLGIRGLASMGTSSAERRSSRMITRDVLPITTSPPAVSVSAAPHQTSASTRSYSSSSGSVQPPRELKLAASTGPPSSLRILPLGSSSPNSGSSDSTTTATFSGARSPLSIHQSFSAPSTSRLPVRHGPAFSPVTTSDSAFVQARKVRGVEDVLPAGNRRRAPSSSSSSSAAAAAAAASRQRIRSPTSLSAPSQRSSPSIGVNGMGYMSNRDAQDLSPASLTTDETTDLAAQAYTQSSFSDSLAAGSRKKGPPARLVLVPSPPSSYSHSSAGLSQPNSALSAPGRTPKSASKPESFGDLLVPTAAKDERGGRTVSLLSPNTQYNAATSPGSARDAFLTPLQSPVGHAAVVEQTAGSYQTIVQPTPATEEPESSNFALNTAGQMDHGKTDDAPQKDSSQSLRKETDEQASALENEQTSSAGHRETPSAESLVGAFEYDIASDLKETIGSQTVLTEAGHGHTEEVHSRQNSDSHTALSRPASPAPRMAFNTQIFKALKEREATDDMQSSPGGTMESQGQKRPSSVRNNFDTDAIQASPLGPPPSVPLPVLPGGLGDMVQQPLKENRGTSSSSRSRSSEQSRHRPPSVPSLSMRSKPALQSDMPGERRDSRSRAKPAFVPDVPSFGYMGSTTVTIPVTLASPVVDVQPRASPFATPPIEEPQGTSRWSSGSEDEDDRLSIKASRKSVSRSRKGSQSASSSTVSSRRNTSVSSSASLAPLKKSSLFSGLGLRKKSVAALASDASSQASSPMPLLSDSPAPGKADGMMEFPFPMVQMKQSAAGNNAKGTNHSHLPGLTIPSRPERPNVEGVEGSSRGIASRLLQRQVSTPSLNERFASPTVPASRYNQLTPRPSDASLATTASSQGYGSATRATSSASNESSVASPVIERVPSVPWSAELPQAIHGLGIDAHSSAEESTMAKTANDRMLSMRASIKSHRSTDSLSRMQDFLRQRDQERIAVGRPQIDLHPKRGSARQRSITLGGEERRSLEARDSALKAAQLGWNPPYSAVLPSMPFSGSTDSDSVHRFMSSPDETPRIAYATLSNSSHAHEAKTESDNALRQTRRRPTDEEEGLFAMGQALVGRTCLPPPTETAHREGGIRKSSTHKRVRRVPPTERPRYPSLTDFGREWQAHHPDDAFCAALGPALLEFALEAVQGERAQTGSTSGNSDAGTESYGSSHSVESKVQSARGAGGGRGDKSNDDQYNRRRLFTNDEIDSDADSSVSEDSYGASDNELPRGDVGVVGEGDATAVPGAAIDDVPIGRSTRDPVETLKRLQRSQSSSSTTKPRRKPEIPAGQIERSFDAQDLAKRLHDVQRSRSLAGSSSHSRIQQSKQSTQDAHDRVAKVMMPPPQQVDRVANGAEAQSDRNKPLADPPAGVRQRSGLHAGPTLASSDRASSSGTSEMGAPRRPSQEKPQAAIVSDFAHTVRMRSQSRSRLRPVAMDYSTSAPVPALPLIGAQSHLAGRSQSQSQLTATAEPAGRIGTQSHGRQPHISPVEHEVANQQHDHSPFRAPRSMASPRGTEDVEHRVYSLNRQQYTTLSVSSAACARDLIMAMLHSDSMPADSRVGGWAIFDVCMDLGLERPLREYERLSDVIAARNSPRQDYFAIKRTDLAPYLSIQSLPNTSPALAGWIYIQESGRKRAWNKRWLELRDQTLYHAKSDKGRDETKLCHLSAFDVFSPVEGEAWASKAPKKNAFALRNLLYNQHSSEEAAFYLCLSDPRAARHWVTAINRARTYLLRQQKPQLFVQRSETSSAAMQPVRNAIAAEGNAQAQPQPSIPQRPLVQLHAEKFEKGSLLDNALHSSVLAEGAVPPPRGSSAVYRKPVPGSNGDEAARQRLRQDEVRHAERQGRMEGRPLIGVVADLSLHASNAGARPLEEQE